MLNYHQKGDSLETVAPAALVSGEGVVIGAMFGVSTGTYASGAPCVLQVTGVVELPKAAGAVTFGAKVYWDATNKRATTTASTHALIGYATAAKLSNDPTALVRLNGGTTVT